MPLKKKKRETGVLFLEKKNIIWQSQWGGGGGGSGRIQTYLWEAHLGTKDSSPSISSLQERKDAAQLTIVTRIYTQPRQTPAKRCQRMGGELEAGAPLPDPKNPMKGLEVR